VLWDSQGLSVLFVLVAPGVLILSVLSVARECCVSVSSVGRGYCVNVVSVVSVKSVVSVMSVVMSGWRLRERRPQPQSAPCGKRRLNQLYEKSCCWC